MLTEIQRDRIILVLGGLVVVRNEWVMGFPLPNPADWIFFFIACVSAAWSTKNFGPGNMKVFLPVLM